VNQADGCQAHAEAEPSSAPTSASAPRVAIYAGSFDPITNGHLYMIQEGARIFERLIVAVGVNPGKRCSFSVEQRIALLRSCTQGLARVEIAQFENQYLIHYAAEQGARYILRGIRNQSDFEFERTMRNVNADLAPGITTVFLMPPRQLAEVSSSFVKGLIGPNGWEKVVEQYVPRPVLDALLKAHPDGI
jgi:pantetheine-phosphate adenylyltransferase